LTIPAAQRHAVALFLPVAAVEFFKL